MAWSLGVTLQEAQFFPVRIDCQNAIWLLEGQEIRSIFQINKVATNVKKETSFMSNIKKSPFKSSCQMIDF